MDNILIIEYYIYTYNLYITEIALSRAFVFATFISFHYFLLRNLYFKSDWIQYFGWRDIHYENLLCTWYIMFGEIECILEIREGKISPNNWMKFDPVYDHSPTWKIVFTPTAQDIHNYKDLCKIHPQDCTKLKRNPEYLNLYKLIFTEKNLIISTMLN